MHDEQQRVLCVMKKDVNDCTIEWELGKMDVGEGSRVTPSFSKTMPAVTIDVPADIAESFETLDDLRRTMYEDFVIEQRQRGNISLGRAAEVLDISYRAFFDLLGEKGLSFINASPQERDESYQHLHHVMNSATP